MNPKPALEAFAASRDGAAIVEFTFAAAVFLTLTFSMIEVSWLAYNQASLSHATSKAARLATINEGTLSDDAVAAMISDGMLGIRSLPEVVQTNVTDPITGISEYRLTVTMAFDSLTSLAPIGALQLSSHAAGAY